VRSKFLPLIGLTGQPASTRIFSRFLRSLTLVTAGFSGVLALALPQAKPDLEYHDRGRYAEGIKPEPVSAYDIELISALVDYKEPADHLPDQLKLWFYLPSLSEANFVVRELDYRLYYWLDSVRPPASGWHAGGQNAFDWPTTTVLRPIDAHMDVYALGAVIRLGKKMPASIEDVAPAILYHSRLPDAIRGYLFTMRVNGDARLSCSVYGGGGKEPISTQMFRRIPGGRSFTEAWNAAGSQDDWYRVVCKGFFLDTNDPLEQTIRFYHKRTVK
jgi:hypothetical protein